VAELCSLCNTRRPRRFCAGLQNNICAQCCGTEREVTVSCPYGCEYLAESRRHEKPSANAVPHPDVEITDAFMSRNELLLMFSINIWGQVLSARENLVLDRDVRAVLAALTAEPAVPPPGPLALELHQDFTQKFTEWRAATEQRAAAAGHEQALIRDVDVRRIWIFLERTAAAMDNGRPRCRAFLDMVHGWLDRVATNAELAEPAGPEPAA